MIGNYKVLGLIPARGGSKGIPGKNIYPLNGKPLINYTVEAALASKYLDAVVVSTDDSGIAAVSKSAGAKVPFVRPDSISQDTSSSMDVILHALEFLKASENVNYDLVMVLQPTSPLRITCDIDESLEQFVNSDADSLASVTKSTVSPYWFRKISEDGFLQEVFEFKGTYLRRQDTESLLLLNGAIYIHYAKLVLSGKIIQGGKILPFMMPEERSVDIDNMFDMKVAEAFLKDK